MSKTTYLDFLDGVKSYYGTGSDQWVEIAKYGLKADNALEILSQIPDVEVISNANGTVRGISYKGFTSWGGYPSNIGDVSRMTITIGTDSDNGTRGQIEWGGVKWNITCGTGSSWTITLPQNYSYVAIKTVMGKVWAKAQNTVHHSKTQACPFIYTCPWLLST